jgi:hypothetical protein
VLSPLPFAVHATIGCPAHAELALSLAWTFHDLDAGAVDDAIALISETIPAPASPSPLDELQALAGLGDRIARGRPAPGAGVDDLMLDSAVSGDVAHPLMRAIIAAEEARRRGLPVGIVSNGRDHCIAHTRLGEPLLLHLDAGAVVDANDLPPTLSWRCAHELCGQVLDALEARWLDEGRPDQALKAAELRVHLPFDELAVERAEQRLAHVQARFN